MLVMDEHDTHEHVSPQHDADAEHTVRDLAALALVLLTWVALVIFVIH